MGLPAEFYLIEIREIAPKLMVSPGRGDQLTLDQPIRGSNPLSPADANEFQLARPRVRAARRLTRNQLIETLDDELSEMLVFRLAPIG